MREISPDVIKLNALTPQQVLDALRLLVAGYETDKFEAFEIIPQVAKALKVDPWPDQYNFPGRAAADLFYGRVKRALDKLADEGALKRVGHRGTGPAGEVNHNREVHYYTQAAWDYQAARIEANRRDRHEELDRHRRVFDRLTALGVGADIDRYGYVKVGVPGLEKLLDLAERGNRPIVLTAGTS